MGEHVLGLGEVIEELGAGQVAKTRVMVVVMVMVMMVVVMVMMVMVRGLLSKSQM